VNIRTGILANCKQQNGYSCLPVTSEEICLLKINLQSNHTNICNNLVSTFFTMTDFWSFSLQMLEEIVQLLLLQYINLPHNQFHTINFPITTFSLEVWNMCLHIPKQNRRIERDEKTDSETVNTSDKMKSESRNRNFTRKSYLKSHTFWNGYKTSNLNKNIICK
jgi:hypothetical protein